MFITPVLCDYYFIKTVIAKTYIKGNKFKVVLKLQKKRLESMVSVDREITNLRQITTQKKYRFVVQFLGCFQTAVISCKKFELMGAQFAIHKRQKLTNLGTLPFSHGIFGKFKLKEKSDTKRCI